MVADTEGARRWANWAIERRQPGWIGLLGNVALLLAAAARSGAPLYFQRRHLRRQGRGGGDHDRRARGDLRRRRLGGARWMHAALAGRVDMLSQALDASPDAQLILAPDGRIAYANTAFHDLFPQSGEPPLDAHRRGARRSGIRGRFRAAAQPGRRRGTRDRGAAAARCARRRGRLVQRRGQPDRRPARLQLLEYPGHHRPPRDGGGDPRRAQQARRFSRRRADRLLFGRWRRPVSVRQSDAWRSGSAAPPRRSSASDARLHDFLASPPADGHARRPTRSAAVATARSAARSCCKSRDGRIIQAWIGQSMVGSGAELRTRSVVRDLTPGARMGSRAAAVARTLPAVLRQRAGRHRADRPVRPAGGGEPRPRRIVRRAAAGSDRASR